MPEISPTRWVTTCSWDDVPHLSDEAKRDMLAETPEFLRDARSKGIPSLGSGAVWPVHPDKFRCDPFPLPKFWPRCYGLDVGWNRTAAIWAAWDRDTDTVYLYTEHYRSEAVPSVHVAAIKARGIWIPGVADPATQQASQKDGEQLYQVYEALGLNLSLANNSVEAGIYDVMERLSTGRLKVFSTCQNWFWEFALYRRDEKGKIVKKHDHLMDTTKYVIRSGLLVARTEPFSRAQVAYPPVADAQAGY